ncbi:uncharacterized protein LOC143497115 [Brachyhypopomus gauderio]|uniref:uncharacterized protein LOC143497115 n=1 Tax=Brachyhypopomus gauderio TaxID=698409 RepID=UPI0040427440
MLTDRLPQTERTFYSCILLNTAMQTFAVVEFREGGTVAIIPNKWLHGPEKNECYWPVGHKDVNKAVRDCTNPQENWERYRIRVLGEAVSYTQAREKLKKAEMTSDLQTDSEAERGPRRRRKGSYPAQNLKKTQVKSLNHHLSHLGSFSLPLHKEMIQGLLP